MNSVALRRCKLQHDKKLPFSWSLVLAIADGDNGNSRRWSIVNRDRLLTNRSDLLMFSTMITDVFSIVMMRLNRLLLPMSIDRRMTSQATGRRALLHTFLHRTQLLSFLFVFMPVLRLLRYSKMMLMMLRDTPFAPTLRGMLNQCAGVVNLGNRKHRPLFTPKTITTLIPCFTLHQTFQ